jgi:hypothetical protein
MRLRPNPGGIPALTCLSRRARAPADRRPQFLHRHQTEDDWGGDGGGGPFPQLPGATPYKEISINSNARANATAAAESTLRLNFLIRLS